MLNNNPLLCSFLMAIFYSKKFKLFISFHCCRAKSCTLIHHMIRKRFFSIKQNKYYFAFIEKIHLKDLSFTSESLCIAILTIFSSLSEVGFRRNKINGEYAMTTIAKTHISHRNPKILVKNPA